MTPHDTCIVVLNQNRQVIGFLNVQDDHIEAEPVAEFAIEFEVLVGDKPRMLQLPVVGVSGEGNALLGLEEVSSRDPRVLEATVETLRREGVLAHMVPTALKLILLKVNGLYELEARQEALSYLLYIPASQADEVAKDFTDLQTFIARSGATR